jgi:hypothetical protein
VNALIESACVVGVRLGGFRGLRSFDECSLVVKPASNQEHIYWRSRNAWTLCKIILLRMLLFLNNLFFMSNIEHFKEENHICLSTTTFRTMPPYDAKTSLIPHNVRVSVVIQKDYPTRSFATTAIPKPNYRMLLLVCLIYDSLAATIGNVRNTSSCWYPVLTHIVIETLGRP